MSTEIHRVENGQVIKGIIFNMFLIEGNNYFLVDLKIYADGFLDCFGPITFEELDRSFKSGRLSIQVSKELKDMVLYIPYIGRIRFSSFFKVDIEKRDPIEIIKNVIIRLNKEETESDRCMGLFKRYLIDPNKNNYEALKESFDKLPGAKNLFEGADYKDPVVQLFKRGLQYSREEREYMLYDYFEGEWIEIK
jgi:hypothetical protein